MSNSLWQLMHSPGWVSLCCLLWPLWSPFLQLLPEFFCPLVTMLIFLILVWLCHQGYQLHCGSYVVLCYKVCWCSCSSLSYCSYQDCMVIMDTFPATFTKYTKVPAVAIVNCAYHCPCAYYGYPCYRGYKLHPTSDFVVFTKLVILVGM